MNEELNLAVGELRVRSRTQVWFLPVVFAGGVVPDWPVGPGETLQDFNFTILSPDTWADGLAKLIRTIQSPRPSLSDMSPCECRPHPAYRSRQKRTSPMNRLTGPGECEQLPTCRSLGSGKVSLRNEYPVSTNRLLSSFHFGFELRILEVPYLGIVLQNTEAVEIKGLPIEDEAS
jgi:hypothetical protein